MKKVYMIAAICLFMIFGKSDAHDNVLDSKKTGIRMQISSIIDVYHDKVYEAMFSIRELRSYAILQNDRLIESYNNKWVSPKHCLSLLNSGDKRKLLTTVVDLIADSEDKLFEKEIIRRLRNWCVAEMQFSFLIDRMGFDLSTIILSVHNIPGSHHVVENFYEKIAKAGDGTKLSPAQEQEAYFDALNLIASISFDKQMRYFSEMYNQLASLSSADIND
ncbi:MAG: hypothetical protein KAH48_11920 [Chlorobi bacterium]|nr:hypothetical protein [Chlorobiota bacterium]